MKRSESDGTIFEEGFEAWYFELLRLLRRRNDGRKIDHKHLTSTRSVLKNSLNICISWHFQSVWPMAENMTPVSIS